MNESCPGPRAGLPALAPAETSKWAWAAYHSPGTSSGRGPSGGTFTEQEWPEGRIFPLITRLVP